jgi:hypothetical protein
MNYPAASSGVSTKDTTHFIVASDGVLDPQLRNKTAVLRFDQGRQIVRNCPLLSIKLLNSLAPKQDGVEIVNGKHIFSPLSVMVLL